MRPQGKIKLGFFPLPIPEAERLRAWLSFSSDFSALDACVGDGAAFTYLLKGTQARRYGIEIDANRAEQARNRGIETLQANTMEVRCPAEAFSLLYLDPPYDLEAGPTNNQRLELVFLEHAYRWLKCGGVLIFVIPQPQMKSCARILSEHFTDLLVFKLTEPAASNTNRSRCSVCAENDTNLCGTPRSWMQCTGWRRCRRKRICRS